MNEDKSKISHLDWFTIISAGIGLLADAITISSILILTNSDKTAPFAIWLLAFVSILITVILVGFFARRLFVNRTNKLVTDIDVKNYQRIESGARALTITSGIILLTLYSVTLAITITPEGSKIAGSIFGAVVLGGIASLIISLISDQIASTIYRAFDMQYSLANNGIHQTPGNGTTDG